MVLFEEQLPADAWKNAEEESMKADLMLIVGSSLEVLPAATLPQNTIRHGGRMIINNLSPTAYDHLAEVTLPMDAAECIPLLVINILKNSENHQT